MVGPMFSFREPEPVPARGAVRLCLNGCGPTRQCPMRKAELSTDVRLNKFVPRSLWLLAF